MRELAAGGSEVVIQLGVEVHRPGEYQIFIGTDAYDLYE
jgi:hypothetical protein